MKSVGECMAIGRSFAESVQKALRSLETGLTGFNEIPIAGGKDAVRAALTQPTPDRLLVIAQAFREGLTVSEIHAACKYDPWFLEQIEDIGRRRNQGQGRRAAADAFGLHALKRKGFSDARWPS